MSVRWWRGLGVFVVLFVLAGVVALFAGAGLAWGVVEGTGWETFTQAYPSNLTPGERGTIQIDLVNIGAKRSVGVITVADTLPRGVAAKVRGGAVVAGGMEENRVEEPAGGKRRWVCEAETGGVEEREKVTCRSDLEGLSGLPNGTGNKFELFERIGIEVGVAEGASEGRFPNRVTAAGGGAVGVTVNEEDVTVSSAEAGFGFSGWDVWFSNADGTLDTQAGSHPYETTFVVAFNEAAGAGLAGGEPRNLEVELPPGFFGEPNVVPRCTEALLDAEACPADTVVGDDVVMLATETDEEPGRGPRGFSVLPVYDMVPPEGVTAEFASKIAGKPAYFVAEPRGFGSYAIVTRVSDVPEVGIATNYVTLWGVPPEASHDAARAAFGESPENKECGEHGCPSGAPPRPFLTLPTSCLGPQAFTIRALGTWQNPAATEQASSVVRDQLGAGTGFTGCSALSFDPSIAVAPESGAADTPTGLGVDVTMPQEALRTPGRLVEATIKNTSVTLPAGFVINPGQAAGLAGCTEREARIEEGQSVSEKEEAPVCPGASRVGEVRARTPLLEGELEGELRGGVYVLAPYEGRAGERPRSTLQSKPPGVQLLLVLSGDGVNLKLVADVQLNEATGQVTSTLTETPGLPVTGVEVLFAGHGQAGLATPAACGVYTATSDFTPWTSPFGADLFPSSSFVIESGPHGGGCPPSPLPFQPELVAGSTTDQAGGYSGFSLLLGRGDGQQRIERLALKMPEGVGGVIGAVTLCPEPLAASGECSRASEIGTATVASGPGEHPLVIPQPGEPPSRVYLTGPYEGAPFGLSITTHVIAGPFNLEKNEPPCECIVTRAKIEVDPLTAQITVTTQPLPQIIDGVPTDLRLVDSEVSREHFLFNPTNCTPTAVTGTAWGTPPPGVQGAKASAAIDHRFQVGACEALKFKPTLKVTTSAHASRLRGTSLRTVLTLPNEIGQGKETNVKRVKVSLPKKLPTPLKTLQKACTETVFAENPAHCPEASQVGYAKVATQVLPGGLAGPAYFVSHGSAKYPELIIVLTGENGITIQVHAETFISKAGVTTATFNSAPDDPFTTFELTFPQRQYPALTTDGNLCKGKLQMPTEIVGQDDATIKQNTTINVTGCPKTKKKKTHHKHHASRNKHKHKRSPHR